MLCILMNDCKTLETEVQTELVSDNNMMFFCFFFLLLSADCTLFVFLLLQASTAFILRPAQITLKDR